MIVTFYSYKGGVGRSMALAAAARALALRGLKVLVVDFDLEAPGLERYFHDEAGARSRRAEPGLMDLIAKYREALTDSSAFEKKEFQQLERYQLPAIHTAGTRGGSVFLLSAGCREPQERLRQYALSVRNFDWQDFFYNWKGDRFFDWLRRRWLDRSDDKGFDIVLVDSRTGVTEMGGVCAYQLADAVLLLCAPNWQNLEGTRDVARDFTSESVLALRHDRRLQTVAVPARLAEEHPRRAAFLADFKREMGLLGMPKVLADAGLSYETLSLRFDGKLSVGELAIGDPAGPLLPGSAFGDDIERLASALLLLAPADGPLAQARRDALAHLSGQAVPVAAPLQADASKSSAGFDVFVDYGRSDVAMARRLVEGLERRGLKVFFDERDIAAGQRWQPQLERALAYSASLVLLFGEASVSEARAPLLALARRQIGLRLVPLLLPGGRFETLASFGVDTQQALDLRSGVDEADIDALAGLLRTRPGVDPAAESPRAEVNPFPGPQPFDDSDSAHFVGRDRFAHKLAQAVVAHDIVVLEGAAQVGKTSLVRAGLVPLLRLGMPGVGLKAVHYLDGATGQWQPPRRRQRAAKADALELVVLDHADQALPEAEAETHREALLTTLLAHAGTDYRLLVVRRGTRPLPPALVHRRPPVLQLPPLERAAFKRALEEPARGAGLLLEPGLAERLIDSAGPARNAVAQVQRVMPRLWEQRNRGWLTNQALNGMGHLAGAFRDWVQQALAAHPALARISEALFLAAVSPADDQRLLPRARPWARLLALGVFDGMGPAAAAHARDTLAGLQLLDLWHDDDAGVMLAPVRSDCRDYIGLAPRALHKELLDFIAWRAVTEPLVMAWVDNGRTDDAVSTRIGLDPKQNEHWLRRRREWLLAEECDYLDSVEKQRVLRVPDGAGAEAGTQLDVLSGRDAVTLEITDGPTLVLHPQTVRDLFAAADGSGRDAVGAAAIGLPSLSRVRVLELEPARETFVERVHAIEGGDRLVALDDAPDPWLVGREWHPPATYEPLLVLVHGLLADCQSTFAPLWHAHPQVWQRLQEGYRGRTGAFQRASLSRTPVENALALARALPPGARLHLLTHGTGGLVAEVLACASAWSRQPRRAEDELAGSALHELTQELAARGLHVERVVRVACPARGQSFAAGRLDAYLSIFGWVARRAGVALPLRIDHLVLEAARQRIEPAALPGLAAALPGSSLLRWLPAVDEPVPGSLRVIAGTATGAGAVSAWLRGLMVDSFFETDNDLLVPTRSMFGGVPRQGGATFFAAEADHFGYFTDATCTRAIADAVLLDDPPGFQPIGPLSFAGDSATGLR